MPSMENLVGRRLRVLEELAGLGEMRRGSICEQFVETTGRNGRKKRRGPYYVYTYKEKGKTVSRRLTNPGQVALCQKQIQAFRRYQELSGQLLEIGEQISDLTLAGESLKKTSPSSWQSRKTPK
jgi:hypothetical protein